MKKILIIDDDRSITKTLKLHLSGGMKVLTADTAAGGLKIQEEESPDVVVLDIRLPDMDGLKALERIKRRDENVCVIMITAFQDMETTVEAIQKGAFDYIPKPINLDELDLSIKRAFESIELHRRLNDVIADAYSGYRVDAIVGKSRAMEEIFKTIGIASQSKVTTLIQGESGTGKELIARAIHYNSREKDRPFVPINCSALVPTLLESELFGHEKGAFTGAISRKPGKFEIADGGTIFLDEIGEMSQPLQAKLLRVLQEKSFERVGGNETIRTDVRVISATNRNLHDLVEKGLFREDLYYRLRGVTINVPPLRERKEDIPCLVTHLLGKANRDLHKDVRKVPEKVMEALVNYSWPGNVRELENVITRGVLLARGDVLIDVFLPDLAAGSLRKEAAGDWEPESLDAVEKVHIERVLAHTGWNKSRAARILGVSLPRLLRKISKYGLRP